MISNNNDSFALQRLYEKWVVKNEWLLNEEAVPLLLGIDPESKTVSADCESLRIKAHEAISNGSLKIIDGESATLTTCQVKPAVIYHWAMAQRLELPRELVNLMEFVLKTLAFQQHEAVRDNQSGSITERSDIEQILGACFALVATFPDECKNNRGLIKAERVLTMLDKHSGRLFSGKFPTLSSTAIRDILNHWLMKLSAGNK